MIGANGSGRVGKPAPTVVSPSAIDIRPDSRVEKDLTGVADRIHQAHVLCKMASNLLRNSPDKVDKVEKAKANMQSASDLIQSAFAALD